MMPTLSVSKITFEGATLRRGFWLYIVEITSGNGQAAAYVGRTGDTSSANAASLFARMAGHLNDKKNAKSNSLLKRLVATNFVCHECSYRVIGIGPLFD